MFKKFLIILMSMKKLLSFVLSMVLISSNVAFAQTYDISEVSKCKLVKDYSEDTTVNEMDTVIFGKENRISPVKPVEWLVLDKQNNKVLLLTKDSVSLGSYCDYNKNSDDYSRWDVSSARKHLNDTLYKKWFTDEEKKHICPTLLINSPSENNELNGGENTIDKIFLLNVEELNKYFGDIYKNKLKLICKPTTLARLQYEKGDSNIDYGIHSPGQEIEEKIGGWYTVRWWLREPNTKTITPVKWVGNTGNISGSKGGIYGYRPALWIDLDENADHTNDNTSYEEWVKQLPHITTSNHGPGR